MSIKDVLKGKRILIVDDEPDILETLTEMLSDCEIDTAPNFASAVRFFSKRTYDASILDIMGVDGYTLLMMSKEKGVPALMLTAHALDEKNFKKSIRAGACAYIPKEHMTDIDQYLAELILAADKRGRKSGGWFSRLKPYFDKKFGEKWRKKDKDFWGDFNKMFSYDRDDLDKLL